MTALRILRRCLAAPFVAAGWLAVLLGDGSYALGTALGEIADRIRGPP